MMKFSALMILLCASFSVAACQAKALTEPCDVLVRLDPKPETNSFIIAHDRGFAQGVAMHRKRYAAYRCGR